MSNCELHCNSDAPLTRWLVETGFITDFTVIDVGVRGGFHPKWDALGAAFRGYGFDLFIDAIDPLPKGTNLHYFLMALGEKDGTTEVVNEAYESMMYGGVPPAGKIAHEVQVRKLDTLFVDGLVPCADFIKLDCEGFERYVLDGAENYLEACDLIGVETESSFNLSFHNPLTQFVHAQLPLAKQRLALFDIQMQRLPEGLPMGVHRPSTLNALFARNFVDELLSPANYAFRPPVHSPSPESILKCAIVLELHCLVGSAFLLLNAFEEQLRGVIDLTKAKYHLTSSRIATNSSHMSGMDLIREIRSRIRRRMDF